MKLETKRLIIRDIKPSDAKSIRENINNLNVLRYLLAVPHPYTIKDARWWVNHCAEKQKEKPRTSYEFGISIKLSNKIIDEGSVLDLNKGLELELSHLSEVFSTQDAYEGLNSVIKRSRPVFKGK